MTEVTERARRHVAVAVVEEGRARRRAVAAGAVGVGDAVAAVTRIGKALGLVATVADARAALLIARALVVGAHGGERRPIDAATVRAARALRIRLARAIGADACARWPRCGARLGSLTMHRRLANRSRVGCSGIVR